jgi:hypothetical protein
MANSVSVRIRPRPYLLVGERFNQRVYLLRRFTVISLKVADNGGIKVRHGGDSNKPRLRAV